MSNEEIFDILSKTVNEAKARFDELHVTTKVEYAYLNNWMQNVESIEKAKYVTISLVLSTDDINEGDEYCLSLGAELKKNGLTEEVISKNSESFVQLVDEAYDRISSAESITAEISALAKEASEEFEKLVGEVKKAEKKKRLASLVGIVIILGIFAFIIFLGFLV